MNELSKKQVYNIALNVVLDRLCEERELCPESNEVTRLEQVASYLENELDNA